MAQQHTYRIIIARPGYQPRTHIKEFADVFAAAAWAKARHDGTVRVAVELVPLQAPQTVQEATQ